MDNTSLSEVKTRKAGRPEKYDTHVQPRLIEIEQWIREGLTDYCIADNLGIAVSTLYDYKAKIVELTEVYTRARTKQVQRVVNSLFQRALGYDYKEETTEGGVLTKAVTKHIPGDVNAQRFYLINRDSEHWKPEKLVESGNITINNFQLDEAKKKVSQMLSEYKTLETIDITDFEVIE